MAVPTYTTDLAIVANADATTSDPGTWAELSGHTGGGAVTDETDYYIQNSNCISQSTGTQTSTGAGLQYTYTSNLGTGWVTGNCFFAWQIFLAGNAVATWANGGIRFGVGSSAGNMKFWNAVGSDFGRSPYGGWQNTAIDPTYTADATDGSPATGNYTVFGSLPNIVSAVSKGNPHGMDCIRYGRGKITTLNGESANYGTFAGIAAANDATTARWGLFQLQAGSYLQKGVLSFGSDATLVDFRDANRVIFIDDTPRTYADFNRFEIRNASSRVDWTSISIAALGTLSKGRFEMHANADVNLAKCTFTDMDTFIFQSNATVDDSTWRRCALVTNAAAAFNTCLFDNSTATAAVTTTDLDKLNGCSFISDGTGHAVELTSIGDGTMSWNCITSGYAASDGSSGNEVLYINVTSSSNLAISVTGGASTPTIRKSAGYTGTVSFPSSVTLKMVVTDASGTLISGALAYIDNDDQSPYILNTTTDANGEASVQYSGNSVNGSRWRVRKYGYKQFKQLVNIGTSDITIFVTLVSDPQQS